MSAMLLHRFKREEYHRMGENGAIAPDARVELLDGQIVDMFPIGPTHNSAVIWLNEQLAIASAGRWVVAPQCSMNLAEFHEPQPDLALLKPPRSRYSGRLADPSDVFWLIEVSDSSLMHDREKKLPAYAAAGIEEVWIVNAQKKVVEIYRSPRAGAYLDESILRIGETFSPMRFPDVVLGVAELFDAK